ncbi:MAG: hypothetical protein SFY66_13225 [Oculatellaceae cyanobacterium bins.114]|nr:hypothetical protein [Oculatellaceae cyanobacterium bins.114]
MQTQKAQKIDLSVDYPCPCHRRGNLTPIALTEAFGCNRCQRIFVVQESGYVIEELSANYPYKKAWRWTGNQWSTAHSGLGQAYLPLTLIIILGIVFLMLFIYLGGFKEPAFQAIAALILSTMLVLMLWLACRR